MKTGIAIMAAGIVAALYLTACDDKKPDAKPSTPPAATAAATATAHATAAPAKTGGGW